ncbi:MAG: putative Na+/H+ antiporter [Achromobacter mucicolens]
MQPSIPHALDIAAAIIFALALIHTFTVKQFERLSHRYPRHAGLFHLLGEVEIVFGFWAFVLLIVMAITAGGDQALAYAESRNYTEPLFVFVVMVVAASRPVLQTVMVAVNLVAKNLPFHTSVATAWLGLAAVPLMGSLITEPAAMTIAALMLAPQLFRPSVPAVPKYFALGVLFVNISIGGTLTAYAAPPVLMVAATWNWDSAFMLATFGWKAAIAVVVNATVATFMMRKYLLQLPAESMTRSERPPVPITVVLVHLVVLAAVVALAHHPVAFLGLFLMFLGFTQAYERHQNPLILKEALLVGFFLAGLVILGGMQAWWLQPIVSSLEPIALFFGSLALTAITDNAALTYLGSLIDGISDESKYMLVAGAVAGGGLTVIANAPNPAGVALLKRGFSDETISIGGLLLGALGPTAVAAGALLLL